MAWVELGGASLHYRAARGLPSPLSPALLLVHGAGGSGAHFEPMMAHLAPHLSPIAVDLPGHGLSGGEVLESVEEMADAIDRFLAALGIEGPICYVGHSFGGLLGLKFAQRRPGRVGSLVLIATAAKFRLHPDFVEQASTNSWDLVLFRDCFAPEVPEERIQLVLQDLPRMRVRTGSDALARWADEDLRPHLGAVRVPALVVVPDDDVILSPRHGEFLAREIAGAQLVSIRGAGHYAHVERPELLAHEVNAFLARHAGGGHAQPACGS